MNKIIIDYGDYQLSCEEYFDHVFIVGITVLYKFDQDILLPDTINNKVVDGIIIKEDINPYRLLTFGKFILPDTIQYAYNNQNDRYFSNKFPKDLRYNIGFSFDIIDKYNKRIGSFPTNLLYSILNKRGNLTYKNITSFNKEAFYDYQYNFKYFDVTHSRKNYIEDDYVLKKQINNYFNVYSVNLNFFVFRFYIYNNNAYICSIEKDINYLDINIVIIPDQINYCGNSYKVVGVCTGAYLYNQPSHPLGINIQPVDAATFVLGRNILFLGINCFPPNSIVYLNNIIKNVGFINDYMEIHIPSANKQVTLYGFTKDWDIYYDVINTNLRYLAIPDYDYDNKCLIINGYNLNEIKKHSKKYLPKLHDEECLFDVYINNKCIYLLNNSTMELKIGYLLLDKSNDDLIIPDCININNQDYKITEIGEKACCNSYLNYDQIIIGENVKIIHRYGITINKTYDLIFKGRNIEIIENYGINCYLHKDHLIIPNSIISLVEKFCGGYVNIITFEENSSLKHLDRSCFENFGIIPKLVLPNSILSVKWMALANVIDLSFENSLNPLNIQIFNSYIRNPKLYQMGRYLGDEFNSYKLCYVPNYIKVHEDTETIVNCLNVHYLRKNSLVLADACNQTFINLNKNYTKVDSQTYIPINNINNSLNEYSHKIYGYFAYELLFNSYKITEYKECLYYAYNDNPYELLFSYRPKHKNANHTVYIHPDCKAVCSKAFAYKGFFDGVICEGDNLIYFGKDVFLNSYCYYLEIPSSIIFFDINNYNIKQTNIHNLNQLMKYSNKYHFVYNLYLCNPNLVVDYQDKTYLDTNDIYISNGSIKDFVSEYMKNNHIKYINNNFIYYHIYYCKETDNVFSCVYYDVYNKETYLFQIIKKDEQIYVYNKSDMGFIISAIYYQLINIKNDSNIIYNYPILSDNIKNNLSKEDIIKYLIEVFIKLNHYKSCLKLTNDEINDTYDIDKNIDIILASRNNSLILDMLINYRFKIDDLNKMVKILKKDYEEHIFEYLIYYLIRYQEYDVDFIIQNFDDLFGNTTKFDLNQLPVRWRLDNKCMNKLKTFLRLNNIEII